MRRWFKNTCIILSLVIVIPIVFLYYQANFLSISQFRIISEKIPKGFNNYRILQLTDLHSKQFDNDNSRLLSKIDTISPDIIVITGDMMNSQHDDGHVFLSLAEQLVKSYPLYYIDGNHELIAKMKADRGENDYYPNYITQLENLGVNILNDKAIQLKQNGQSITLRGLDIPLIFYSAADVQVNIDLDTAYINKKIGASAEDKFEILLAHHPKYFEAYRNWGASLILSGHNHGGMIHVPFKGGLLSGDREWFPEYDAGQFDAGSSTMIVGRGLGNYSYNIRMFNRPELVVITLSNS